MATMFENAVNCNGFYLVFLINLKWRCMQKCEQNICLTAVETLPQNQLEVIFLQI